MLSTIGRQLSKEQKNEVLDGIERSLASTEIKVTFYRYRTAMLLNPIFWTDEHPFTNLSQSHLSHRAGNESDNHTVYKLEDREGRVIYLAFSDWHIGLGTQIREGLF